MATHRSRHNQCQHQKGCYLPETSHRNFIRNVSSIPPESRESSPDRQSQEMSRDSPHPTSGIQPYHPPDAKHLGELIDQVILVAG
jgi:hypothetical protein